MTTTESRNPDTMHIDRADTATMLRLIQDGNRRSVDAVEEALSDVAVAVDAVADAIGRGGRLIYLGAGTSGRLAVLDAAECPPTYGTDPGTVVALIAGGPSALVHASENAEDSAEAGRRDVLALAPGVNDVVMGVSASGNASYVTEGLRAAKERGARTVSLSSNRDCAIARIADIPIVTETGAEVVAGSTRMKAGNAQKMVLNMITTCAMIKTGKVYENVMINLRPTNAKLRRRMIGIVEDLGGVGADEAERLLEENGFRLRPAIEAARGTRLFP